MWLLREQYYSIKIYWCYKSDKYNLRCNAATSYWRLLECRWRLRIVRLMDRIYAVRHIERKTSWRIYMVRGEANKETSNIKAGSLIARNLEEYVRCCATKRNGRSRNQNSIMLGDCEEFASKIQRTKIFKKPLKTRKESWKFRWKRQCKISRVTHRKSCGPAESRTRFACIVEANESTRSRFEEMLPREHEDHIAGRGINSLYHNKPVHKFFFSQKQWRFLKHKQQWTKIGKYLRKLRPGNWPKLELRKKWSMKQGKRAEQFPLLHWLISVTSKTLSRIQNYKSIKVELYSEEALWKTFQVLLQYLQNKERQHHKGQQQKSRISQQDYQDAQDKLQTQYQSTPKLKWKMRQLY